MLIVDENTEEQLVTTLKGLIDVPFESRALYFKFHPGQLAEPQRCRDIAALVHEALPTHDAKLYFCEAGELIIITDATATVRQVNPLALKLADYMKVSCMECGFSFFAVKEKGLGLLAHFQQYLNQKKERLERQKALELQSEIKARQASKRQAFLNYNLPEDSTQRIERQRTQRETGEMMVIEDDPFSRRLVESLLGKEYGVTGLGSAEDALTTYIKTAPNVTFLDINLPDVSGHDLLEKIMQIDPQAYVIMLSGQADRENIAEAMRRGAKGFVAKPFTPDKLHQYIRRCPTIH